MEIRALLVDGRAFGLQQKVQWAWLSALNFINSMHLVASVFISASVDYRCKIPGYDNDTYAIQGGFHNATIQEFIPLKDDGYDSCKMWSMGDNSSMPGDREAIECDSYVYDTSQFIETTTTQFNLVCGQVALSTIVNVIYMAGLLVGSLVFGTISDYLGRKWTVYIGICLQGAIAIAIAFSPNFYVFTALRFLLGAVTIGGLIAQFTLMIEICPANRRTLVAISQSVGWCTGVILISGLGYAFRHWKSLQICLACFSVPFILTYWWLLDESPSWLLTRGRFDDALKVVRKMKRWNKLKWLEVESLVNSETKEEETGERWKSVFKAKTLLLNVLLNCFGWFVASMGYYGLALNVGNLVGNLYINNLIGGLVEIPAYFLLLIAMKIGRKPVYIPMMSIGGVALIASAFLTVYLGDAGLNWIIITISMIGKFAVASAFELIFYWAAEMYPTSLRSSLSGINSASARVGGMLSPVIADIPKLVEDWPFAKGIAPLIFGALMIAAGIAAIFLPETNKRPIPNTSKEANRMTFRYRGPSNNTRAEAEDVELETKEGLTAH